MISRQQIKSLLVTSDPITARLSQETDCYENPKEERISCAFGNLTDNIKVTQRSQAINSVGT